jgi:hypothetical protein
LNMNIERLLIILLIIIILVSCEKNQNSNSITSPSVIISHAIINTSSPTQVETNTRAFTKTVKPTFTNTSTPDFTNPCYKLSKDQIETTKKWKLLKSQGGWKVKYPTSWAVVTCRNCWDITDPNIPISFEPKDVYGDSIVINGGNNDERDAISADEYFKSIIEASTTNENINYCSVNGMPALEIISTYKNWYTNDDDLYEIIYIWNNSYSYFISFLSTTQSFNKLIGSDH